MKADRLKALILAAGKTPFRYGFPENYKPKCLLHWKGEVLLERAVKLFRKHGIEDVFVVVGYQANKVKGFAEKKRLRLRFVLNPNRWGLSGTHPWISFRLGLKEVMPLCHTNEGIILCLGDVWFSENVLVKLMKCRFGVCAGRGKGVGSELFMARFPPFDLKKMQKEVSSYKGRERRRQMVISFTGFLRRHGAQDMGWRKGEIIEFDHYWRSGEGIKLNAIREKLGL